MIRGFLLLSIGATLYASSDYIPFSKFSQSEQIEHNFKKAALKTDEKIEQVKQIKKVSIRNYKKPTETNIVKKIEIRKPVVQKNTEFKEKKVIQEERQEVKQETVQKTRYKQDILYSARLTFSPLTSDYSSSLGDYTDKSNSIEPSGSVSFGKNKIEASYFKTKNDFNSIKAESTLYKLSYKYNYKNVNIGLGANHLVVDRTTNSKKETFPSLEVDFKNSSGLLELEYGASLGKNKNIDYSYEYFINLNIKPYENSDQALVLGYKNRTIEDADEKLEFQGPYVGINTKF